MSNTILPFFFSFSSFSEVRNPLVNQVNFEKLVTGLFYMEFSGLFFPITARLLFILFDKGEVVETRTLQIISPKVSLIYF
jgi:hypothetical protein